MIKITKIALSKFQRIPPSTTIVVSRPLKTLGNDTGNREYPNNETNNRPRNPVTSHTAE